MDRRGKAFVYVHLKYTAILGPTGSYMDRKSCLKIVVDGSYLEGPYKILLSSCAYYDRWICDRDGGDPP